MQGRAGCGRTARNCAHIPRVQWVAASAASLPATRHAALASRLSGRCSCPSAQVLRGQLLPPLVRIRDEVKNDRYLIKYFRRWKNTVFVFGGAAQHWRWCGVLQGRRTPRHTCPRAYVFRRPRAGRALQQVLLSDTGHRCLRPRDRDLRVTPARCVSHHRATTAEQPYGVYDIGYYESPYETFFCYDYGAD